MLRCTHCHNDFDTMNIFEPIKEFQKCSRCGIGILVGDHFGKTGESAIFDHAIDSFGIDENDYEEAGIEMPEHPNCRCVEPVVQASLSFSDMNINEKLLIGLPIEEVVPITYITEMNQRFLHTFVDSCFVPV